MAEIYKKKIKLLPESYKNLISGINKETKQTYFPKENTAWSIISRILLLLLGLIILCVVVLLGYYEFKSYPEYMFSLWLFIVAESVLFLVALFFVFMFFDGISAVISREKYFIHLNDNEFLARIGNKAIIIPWDSIKECIIAKKDENNVKRIKILFNIDGKATKFSLPNYFEHNFNRIYGIIYQHLKKESLEYAEWPIVMGVSLKSEKLPSMIHDIITKKNIKDIRYFEAKKHYARNIFLIILLFVVSFGFIMTIFDLVNITNFWGLELVKYPINIRIFLAVLFGLLCLACLGGCSLFGVKLISHGKQELFLTKEGLIEKMFDIVYVIPWKAVKEMSTKWFSYGAVESKGELKIQIVYNEKPKSKEQRIYNIQGDYRISVYELLDIMKKHWKE